MSSSSFLGATITPVVPASNGGATIPSSFVPSTFMVPILVSSSVCISGGFSSSFTSSFTILGGVNCNTCTCCTGSLGGGGGGGGSTGCSSLIFSKVTSAGTISTIAFCFF